MLSRILKNSINHAGEALESELRLAMLSVLGSLLSFSTTLLSGNITIDDDSKQSRRDSQEIAEHLSKTLLGLAVMLPAADVGITYGIVIQKIRI